MTLVDQQGLRTIVEIDEYDSFTTNSSSSCFTSPSAGDSPSPPVIRPLQTLSLAPRPAFDLWNVGVYSSLSTPNVPPNVHPKVHLNSTTQTHETTSLNRKLTLNSDSGRESVDSSFSSENELSPPAKRYTTRALTIYEIEKAKQRSTSLPKQKARCSFTASSKVFIDEKNFTGSEWKQPQQSEPSSTVLRIYIPPAVKKNVADRIAKHKEALNRSMDTRHERIVVRPDYGLDSSDYRVVAWESPKETPGRIADFKPEVDRWHEKKTEGPKNGSQSSAASSSLLTSLIVGAEADQNIEEGNTLSDVSSCASSQSVTNSLRSSSTNKTKSTDSPPRTNSSISHSSKVFINGEETPSLSEKSSLEKSLSPTMLNDRVVEVGVKPWKSLSVEQFTSRPQLISEKTKKKVIFPSEPEQHVYENIEDCRERGIEHSGKILPLPSKRLPFRQPARVPVLSVPKIEHPFQLDSEVYVEEDVNISPVSYRFYDRNMQQQNSLSKRCSAQLLKRTAMRLSLPRSKSASNRGKYGAIQPFRESSTHAPKLEPLRYQMATDRTERTSGHTKSRTEENALVTVNGKQTCANCHFQLGRGQAMTIDSLGLFYHLHCFRCSDCGVLLSSGNAKGMDVRVCGTKIQCNQCYSFANLHCSQI